MNEFDNRIGFKDIHMNKGIELWKKAVTVIPGGNGLLSKRPDRYAPDIWPTYFSRAKGCDIWDLEGNKYVDMAQMGIGSAILGYTNDELNAAVCQAIEDGVNTTLNAPEEVLLAEELLKLNSGMGAVKFTRSGGEAMAMAVRIIRAASGRDKVAFSGYHGWSDWYLATNLSNSTNLNEHLLSGLAPKGVPSGLAGTAVPFKYNDVADFKRMLDANPDIGGIVFEGARYDFPQEDFLNEIQKEADKRGILTVVDEITSGLRMSPAGVYTLNGFVPDMVVYGKALGGGFAISAVLGTSSVMSAAQDTFISSTFWTERVGFVAGLKTLEIIQRDRLWEQLISTGEYIGEAWQDLADKHGLKLHVTDFKPLITMKLEYGDQNNQILTYFIQEMLKRGYLAASSIYLSAAHTKKVVKKYLLAVDEVFALMADAIAMGVLEDRLETRVRTDSFSRLN